MQPQYPQQPNQFPPAPQQPYPNQQPPQAYPPQAPPGYPPQPQAYPPQPQYAPPAPQGYPPQYAPPPVAPAMPGTLDAFYNQPSTGGGKALTFEQPGTTYTGIVTRAIGNGDIQQQTDTQGRPSFFKDGRPKFVMKVPLQMQPSPLYPDGLGQWYIKGAARDELVRAMAEAGAPEGPPEANAVITITLTGTRPSGPGMNPTKLFAVQYRRPQGASPVAAPAAQAAPPQVAEAPAYHPAPPPVYAVNDAHTNGNHNPLAPTAEASRINGGQPPQYAAPAATHPPTPVPQPAPIPPSPVPPAAPVDLSPEQQALLAQLTGQPAH